KKLRQFVQQLFILLGLIASTVRSYGMPADTISLNGVWKFKTDLYNAGEPEGWYKPEYSVLGWDTMKVPGNWDVRNEYTDYAGKAWYLISLKANPQWKEKNSRLIFESVYNDAIIWLNGERIGENHLGFFSFFYDINPHLRYGKENILVVMVDNT